MNEHPPVTINEKPKPCPFCGGEAIIGVDFVSHRASLTYVRCVECEAQTGYDYRSKAIAAWNRRVYEDAQEGDGQ